jgi:hypothetical protein
MTAHTIRESYDGGLTRVAIFDRAERPFAHESADGTIALTVVERGMATANLHLTPTEVDDLIAALQTARAELATQNTRSSASVGEDRYPCGGPDCSGHLTPRKRCLATGTETWTAADMAREVEFLDPLVIDVAQAEAVAAEVHGTEEPTTPNETPGVISSGRFGFPATSTLSGLSIAEITAARLAAYPDAATVPFEVGGALHIVGRCGCSDCEDAFAESTPVSAVPDRNARLVAAALVRAHDELLANSTAVPDHRPIDPVTGTTSAPGADLGTLLGLMHNPNVCEHGYRFENGLCPQAACGASAYVARQVKS